MQYKLIKLRIIYIPKVSGNSLIFYNIVICTTDKNILNRKSALVRKSYIALYLKLFDVFT